MADQPTPHEPRMIGVEIEFTQLSTERAAEVMQATLGGRVRTIGRHMLALDHDRLGTFTLKLDTRYADTGQKESELASKVRGILGSLISVVVPLEIITPPLPEDDIVLLDELVERLVAAGAKGTQEAAVYGFGLHLNPEVRNTRPQSIAGVMAAFGLAQTWLERTIGIDPTRQILQFAQAYPDDYVTLLLTPDYPHDLDQLIEDYVTWNATRHRALDMLPLFEHLQPGRITRALPEERVSGRPTLHYRLPDARLGDSDWSVGGEWRRLRQVEALSRDETRMAALRERWQARTANGRSEQWYQTSRAWLEQTSVP